MTKRGEVWLANLNPRRGTEPGKTRPVLVVQAQALIDAGHPSTLIIPLTTNLIDDAEPLRVRVLAQSSLRRDSDLLIDQLRAIDNRVLVKGPLARLDEAIMEGVGDALREVLDLD
ncbi:MAG: type II toxin-antitoxin system PemK/MazF family toxin [Candidatus Binatus sp.]|uniref:type II toxin-antitoxin system PemK/MazF family toxin n=1 Tax=Candidatus Binatus sp. TaxID=2811406 RepID=UPI003BAFA6A6